MRGVVRGGEHAGGERSVMPHRNAEVPESESTGGSRAARKALWTYENADGMWWWTGRAHSGWRLDALVRHQMAYRVRLSTAGNV